MPHVLLADLIAPEYTLSSVNGESLEIVTVSSVCCDNNLLFDHLDVVKLAAENRWEDAFDGTVNRP